ncbi:MAG: MFS transporter [Thermodesulfovibrionales bacterium]
MCMKNGQRCRIVSWCLFDFANSSYSAVIAAVVFQVYFITTIAGNAGGSGDLWWGRAVSLSMAVVALTSPLLGGIADFGGFRKRLLMAYSVLCILSVAGFSVLVPGSVAAGFLLIVLANIGMEGGLVFYNSFLPEIAHREIQGRVSAWGYGVGYTGSIISLLAALFLVRQGRFQETWLMVSLFFLVFSLPAFVALPGDRSAPMRFREAAGRGFGYTVRTLRELVRVRDLRLFLAAYFLYEDGVNTVIIFSSSFAATTLGFGNEELIGLYLMVQATASAGAFVMAKPIDAWGPKRVVLLSLALWTSVTVAAFFIREKQTYWAVACIAGLGLGTVQAASRAFFSQFIPDNRESEYFGVYSLVGKSSAILGPLVFGQLSSVFGSQRPAILAISLFFLAGFLLLLPVRGGGPNIVTQ